MSKSRLIIASLFTAAAVGAGFYFWAEQAPTSTAKVAELAKQSDAGRVQINELALSDTVLSDDDLPPEGTRSLFDNIAAANNGVPYPFSKLVETLTKMNPSGEQPVIVMLPHGRSLLKGQSDDTKPRVLLAADFQAPNTPAALGVNTRRQLILGFVENADEIEVLSYNEAAGRFEFQLVQDYSATGARKLLYAKRQVCLTCHQGGAPIFSQRPWEETTAASGTIEAMLRARTQAGLDPHSYLGMPTVAPLSAPERFDELTDVGNFFATTQKLWLDGCGDPAVLGQGAIECRKTALKLALKYKAEPGAFREEGPLVEKLRELQANSLGDKTVAVAESDLTNRNPVAEQQGFKAWLRSLTTARIKLGDGAKDNEDLEAFDQLPKLPLALDPLTKREPKRLITAEQIDGAYGLASLFTESDIDTLMQAANYEFTAVSNAIDTLPSHLFEAKPFERVKMMQALLKSPALPVVRNNAPIELAYAYSDVSDMSAPMASGAPALQLSFNSPLQNYENYCFSCHRGNPAKRLNFMGADTAATVLAQIREKVEIRDALDWARYEGTDKASIIMPPPDSKQYALMKEELARNPELLIDMRKQVPSLFGF